jgi:hypothetical protein
MLANIYTENLTFNIEIELEKNSVKCEISSSSSEKLPVEGASRLAERLSSS